MTILVTSGDAYDGNYEETKYTDVAQAQVRPTPHGHTYLDLTFVRREGMDIKDTIKSVKLCPTEKYELDIDAEDY